MCFAIMVMRYASQQRILHDVDRAPDTDLRAPLLADVSIWHNSLGQNSGFIDENPTSAPQIGSTQIRLTEVTFTKDGTSQLSITQIGIDQPSLTDYGTAKISINQAGVIEAGFTNAAPSEIGLLEISSDRINSVHQGTLETSIDQDRTIQTTSIQNRTTQTGSFKIASIEVGMSQISPSQINSLEVGTTEGSFGQANSSKISLPSSVTLQQFLSSHNFNLQNTTISTWTEFLTGTTPFNLNIEITDRPTYDSRHNPVSSFHIIPLK
jgi:hypothetical protein